MDSFRRETVRFNNSLVSKTSLFGMQLSKYFLALFVILVLIAVGAICVEAFGFRTCSGDEHFNEDPLAEYKAKIKGEHFNGDPLAEYKAKIKGEHYMNVSAGDPVDWKVSATGHPRQVIDPVHVGTSQFAGAGPACSVVAADSCVFNSLFPVNLQSATNRTGTTYKTRNDVWA